MTVVDHAEALTPDACAVAERYVEAMRHQGISDHEILGVSYFRFVNRIALGPGVGYAEEEVGGYRC